MTLGKLKQKIKDLEESEVIDDNTIVCGFNDEFCSLYSLEDDHPIVRDIDEKDLAYVYEMIQYYNDQKRFDRAKDMQKKYDALKRLGKTVICLI